MFYQQKVEEVFAGLKSGIAGLKAAEAERRLAEYGPNELEEQTAEPLWKLAVHQFTDPLVVILLLAAIITIAIAHYADSFVILAVVLVNGALGFSQEFKAGRAMQALKKLSARKATVIRNDKEERIDAAGVVPGDVVLLSTGNRVPADLRLFEVKELSIDESMLTGESAPVTKETAVLAEENLPIADRTNLAYLGTVITHGRGKGIAIATGRATELGRISEQVKETVKEQTPLQKRLAYFTKLIGVISLALAALVTVIGLLRGLPLDDMVLFAISMAVAVIPEGLPIVITVTMAIGLKRMADKNAVIRRLIAVETLGSCDYICSDKTGTITENRMTVTDIYAGGRAYTVTGGGYAPEGEILLDGKKVPDDDEALRQVLRVGLLCSTANHYLDEDDRAWKIDGTPTEGALIVAAKKYGLDPEDEESRHELVDEIAFSSARKYMAMLFRRDGRLMLMVKGAPEKLLQFCGRSEDLALKIVYARMAGAGLRVLGFGMKELAGAVDDIDLEYESTRELTFLGFQGIIDPPKQSAIAAIRGAKAAGIRIMMITGDNRITAAAIARQVGILDKGELVVSGHDLDEKGKAFLAETVERTAAYARVSPLHKLEIVEALQTKGHIVAVTGDGVNDAPALKKGNIGVAMGRAGTDVAREAADMILKDDNFASIFEAVKVGRIIFDNIRKVTYFLLSSSAGIAFSIIAALLLGLPLPYLATQVLWINLVTNGMQDIALAYEPAEEEIGQRPPRSPDEDIVNGEIFARMMIAGVVLMIGTLALFWYELRSGATLRYAQTTAFNTIVFFQFFQVWNARSLHRSILNVHFFSNPFLLFSLLLSVLAQIAVLTWEPFHYIFHTVKLSAVTWLQTLAVSFTIVIVVEIDKAVVRGRAGRQKR